ncbi:hypothetical protein CEXT_255901 [Caerostris extrusa]|uniref:Uncharacterized protein n=1 Tax=Caerostris extrusa TaxID=172846 RepID=A0AAV4WIK6_CAEEX|nr:hypothetical protein CEXT_255901 [Caerostris extrusa]
MPIAYHPVNFEKMISKQQPIELNSLLKNEKCFQLRGGETSPFIEHRINTGDHLPDAVPPYNVLSSKTI